MDRSSEFVGYNVKNGENNVITTQMDFEKTKKSSPYLCKPHSKMFEAISEETEVQKAFDVEKASVLNSKCDTYNNERD